MPDYSYHSDCHRCPLYNKVTHVGIGGDGMLNPKILFIGEGPGGTEDYENRPFVGRSGQVLRTFIQGDDKQKGYITVPWRLTNSVRCRPYVENGGSKKDRPPKKDELSACRKHLIEEIETEKAKILVPLGEVALNNLLGYKGISKWRGVAIEHNGYIIIPTYHPSYVLRTIHDPRSTIAKQFAKDLEYINEIAITGKVTKANVNITVPMNVDELRDALKLLEEKDELAFDVETNSYDKTAVSSLWSPGFKLLSISFAYSANEAVAIPLFHKDSPFAWEPTLFGEYQRILRLLQSKRTIAHNGKFDIEAIWRQWGEWVEHSYDTMLAHYLLEEERGTHDLETLLKLHCPELSIWKVKKNSYDAQIKKEGYEAIPLDELLQYNAYDTLGTFKLKGIFDEQLQEFPQRVRALKEVFMPVSHTLARIEAEGVVPDIEAKDSLSQRFNTKLAMLKECIISEAESQGMENFNPGSVKQMSILLYEKMGLPIINKTEKGVPSTDSDTLLNLRPRVRKGQREFIDMLVSHLDEESGEETESYRSLNKLLTTYLNTMEKFIGYDGKIHPDYLQHGTVTGRISCKNPNLTNQPKSMRVMYKAPDGYTCLEGDYSQGELRLLAYMSQDQNMLETYEKGEDLHDRTAREIFQSDVITSEMRRVAKNTNFGIAYGEGAPGLSEKLNVSIKKAQGYIDSVLKYFPGIKKFYDEQEFKAKTFGFVETPFGNVRHIPQINSPNEMDRAEGIRQAVNSPIQGALGLMCLHKMSRLKEQIDWDTCRMVLNIHDAILFVIKDDHLDFWAKLIKREMEDLSTLPFKSSISFPVDFKIGPNFAKMEEYKVECKQ